MTDSRITSLFEDLMTPELMIHVLEYLNPIELAIMFQVNHQFNKLAHDQFFWRDLTEQLFHDVYLKNRNTNANVDWYQLFTQTFNSRLKDVDPSFLNLYFYIHRNEVNNFDDNFTDLSMLDKTDNAKVSLLIHIGNTPYQEFLDIIFQHILLLPEYRNADGSFNVNYSDAEGRTILHWAAYCKQSQHLITQLISSGCDMKVCDKNGLAIIHIASILGDESTIETLLNLDPNQLNLANLKNMTPIMWATIHGKANIVKLLAEKGAILDQQMTENLNDIYRRGFTALHCATINNDLTITTILLNRGASTTIRNQEGLAPIHIACRNKYIDVDLVQLFLEKNIQNLYLLDLEKQSPLIWAARAGRINVVKFLIQSGAELHHTTHLSNAFSSHRFTALHWAAYNNHVEVVRLLLKAGAQTDALAVNNKKPDDVTDNVQIMKMINIERCARSYQVYLDPSRKVFTFWGQVSASDYYSKEIDAIQALRAVVINNGDPALLDGHEDTLNRMSTL